MDDEQIKQIYNEGNAESHTIGLRKVYEAGQKHDAMIAAAQKPAIVSGAAAVPTKAQISAARRAALEAGKKEGLSATRLLDVQDEAEAELVAKMARGEAIDV